MGFDDYIEYDDKTIYCYMLGLIDADHVYRKQPVEKEYEEYYDLYQSVDDYEKYCMHVFFGSDKRILKWHKKYSFMVASIDNWKYSKPLIMKKDMTADIFPNDDCILSYFIGLGHWILTDYNTNWFDPLSSFVDNVRKDLFPDMEYDRIFDLIEMLDIDMRYESLRIKSTELLGINKLVNESHENQEEYFEPELRNFLESNR